MFGKYRALFRRRDYLLLFGQMVSRFGDRVLYLALMAKAYELTGSALSVGALTVLQLIPDASLPCGGRRGGCIMGRLDAGACFLRGEDGDHGVLAHPDERCR